MKRPLIPGCVAQAWSVAEVLRVIKDYQMYDAKVEKPGKKTKKDVQQA